MLVVRTRNSVYLLDLDRSRLLQVPGGTPARIPAGVWLPAELDRLPRVGEPLFCAAGSPPVMIRTSPVMWLSSQAASAGEAATA